MGRGRVQYALAGRSLTSHRVGLQRLTCNSRGTGKLFRSVVRRTGCRFKFSIDSGPLVMRTVPLSSRSLILLVAGIRCPRRLSAHFSRFARNNSRRRLFSGVKTTKGIRHGKTSSVLRLFRGVHRTGTSPRDRGTRRARTPRRMPRMPTSLAGVFRFAAVSRIRHLTRMLMGCCGKQGSLFGGRGGGQFCLIVRGSSRAPRRFGGIYGVVYRCTRRGGCGPTIKTCFTRRKGGVAKPRTLRIFTSL